MANVELKIEKLSTNNYTVWRTIMESALKGKDLWDYVLATKDDTDENKVKNSAAKTLMYCAMTSQQILATGQCLTARDLWLKIKSNHEGAETTQKSIAYTEFLKLRYMKNESISDFCGRYEIALGKIEATQHTVDEDIKKYVVSNTLPSQLKQTVRMFDMSYPNGTASELITQLKINHSHDINREDNQASAFYAQNNRPNMRRNNQYNSNNKQRNTNQRQQVTCTYCKILGHLWKDCRKLKADNERKKKFGSNRQSSGQRPYVPNRNGQPYRPPQVQAPQYQRPCEDMTI